MADRLAWGREAREVGYAYSGLGLKHAFVLALSGQGPLLALLPPKCKPGIAGNRCS
jgi:hypothetical protein